MSRKLVAKYKTTALDADSWPDFARLAEAHNGVWGGCWCMWYHGKGEGSDDSPAAKRKAKERRVGEGRAHASLIYHDPDCVGWCQFGSPDEHPRIHNPRTYLAADPTLPDWRITCFFSDKGHRGIGVASAALGGAIEQIKTLARFAVRWKHTIARKPLYFRGVEHLARVRMDAGCSGRRAH